MQRRSAVACNAPTELESGVPVGMLGLAALQGLVPRSKSAEQPWPANQILPLNSACSTLKGIRRLV